MPADPNSDLLYEQAEMLKYQLLKFMIPYGIPLYLAFGVADLFYSPKHAPFWISLRLLVAVLTLILGYFLNRNLLSNKAIVLFMAAYASLISNVVNVMLYQSGGVASIYLPGVIMLHLAFLLVHRFSRGYTLITSISIFGPTLIILIHSDPLIANTTLIMCSFPLGSFFIALFYSMRTDESYVSSVVARRRLAAAEYQSHSYSTIAKTAQMIAHDVRKPFSILASMLELIDRNDDPQKAVQIAKKYSPIILQAKSHVDVMLNDILSVDREHENNMKSCDFLAILHTALQRAFVFDHGSRIKLSYDINHTTSLYCDQNKTERIFLNLILNASKAMRGDGVLTFTTADFMYRGRACVKIMVNNTNSYISPQRTEKIFSSFFSESGGGVGLGLTICRKFIEEQGGSISCRSDLKAGTTFDFFLPADSDMASEIQARLALGDLPQTSFDIAAASVQQASTGFWLDSLTKMSRIYLDSKLREVKLQLTIFEDETIYADLFSTLLKARVDVSVIFNSCFVFKDHLDTAKGLRGDVTIVDIDLGTHLYSGVNVLEALSQGEQSGIICVHSDRGTEAFRELIAKGTIQYFIPKPMHEEQFFRLLCLAIEAKLKGHT